MFKTLHKIKPLINKILLATGLYVAFHSVIIKLFSKREAYSEKYIKGKGLEIGALHTPLKVFNNARVTYIDHLDTKGLRKHYPELEKFAFVPVGIVDDGEKLRKVKSQSQNFIIANHFVEHCEDPFSMLKNQLRVLKKGGIIFWAIPNKKFTFDKVRSLTTIEHVYHDYKLGPQHGRKAHYEEWAHVILQLKGISAKKKAAALMSSHYSIHFHVWTKESFFSLLQFAQKKLKLPFKIIEIVPNINEFICILKKT